jgi:hypothetical protein
MEKFILIALGLVIVIIALRVFGIRILQKTEEGGFIDRSRQSTGDFSAFKKQRQRDDARQTADADALLSQFAEEVADGKLSDQTLQQLPKDDWAFFRGMGKKYQQKADDAADMYQMMKASYNTYQKLKTAVNGVVGDTREQIPISTVASDAFLSDEFFDKLQTMFNISKSTSEDFAKQGNKSESDWVDFVERNQGK